jgi:hypothetical protein
VFGFLNKQQWRHRKGDLLLWEMLTKLFVRSYFQQNKLLFIYFFSILWHKFIVLMNMFIYAKDGNSKFVEMHRDASDFYRSSLVFYTRHQVNVTIYQTVFLHTDTVFEIPGRPIVNDEQKRLWTTWNFLLPRCWNLFFSSFVSRFS